MTPKLVTGALKHVWLTLEPLQIPMAVMGGMALSAWEHARATRDVDLLVGLGTSNLDEVLQALYSAGLRPKRQPPITTLGPLRIVQLLYEAEDTLIALQVDLLLAESAYHQQALTRRVVARLPDLDVDLFVLACEDLILHKLMAGRIIDRVDAAALLRANRGTIDQGYLLHWVDALQLGSEFSEVWGDAFPGETPPRI